VFTRVEGGADFRTLLEGTIRRHSLGPL